MPYGLPRLRGFDRQSLLNNHIQGYIERLGVVKDKFCIFVWFCVDQGLRIDIKHGGVYTLNS